MVIIVLFVMKLSLRRRTLPAQDYSMSLTAGVFLCQTRRVVKIRHKKEARPGRASPVQFTPLNANGGAAA
jgi:hypothetical protein